MQGAIGPPRSNQAHRYSSELMFGLPSMITTDESRQMEAWAISMSELGRREDLQLACSAS